MHDCYNSVTDTGLSLNCRQENIKHVSWRVDLMKNTSVESSWRDPTGWQTPGVIERLYKVFGEKTQNTFSTGWRTDGETKYGLSKPTNLVRIPVVQRSGVVDQTLYRPLRVLRRRRPENFGKFGVWFFEKKMNFFFIQNRAEQLFGGSFR